MNKKIAYFICAFFACVQVQADWKVEHEKTFKGDELTYLTAKNSEGAELWIDLADNTVVYRNKNKVINYVNGVKIDGKYFEYFFHSYGDKHDRVNVCDEIEAYECYRQIFSAKKVEVNIGYFRKNEVVSTFIINGTENTAKKYSIDRCTTGKEFLRTRSSMEAHPFDAPWLVKNCGSYE